MLLGATAATSKQNLLSWIDDLITSVASEQSLVYDLSNVRQHGTYTNLSMKEFSEIIAKLSNLKRWTAEIITNGYSCGSLIVIFSGGRSRVSHQAMCVGPFQN